MSLTRDHSNTDGQPDEHSGVSEKAFGISDKRCNPLATPTPFGEKALFQTPTRGAGTSHVQSTHSRGFQ